MDMVSLNKLYPLNTNPGCCTNTAARLPSFSMTSAITLKENLLMPIQQSTLASILILYLGFLKFTVKLSLTSFTEIC